MSSPTSEGRHPWSTAPNGLRPRSVGPAPRVGDQKRVVERPRIGDTRPARPPVAPVAPVPVTPPATPVSRAAPVPVPVSVPGIEEGDGARRTGGRDQGAGRAFPTPQWP